MTDTRSVNYADLVQAVVGVCAFGGVFLFMWAAGTGHGPALGLAVALWVVGGVISFGIDEQVRGDSGDERDVTHRRPVGSVGTDADSREQTTVGALADLRERYARGEMTEAEFDRRVERLLTTDEAGVDDALQTLRERYARGDLSDEQFERKLGRLTDTRTLEDATDRFEREGSRDD